MLRKVLRKMSTISVPEWSRSVVDLPHRLTTSATYDLPVGKNKLLPVNNSLLNFFVGNWSVNAITGYSDRIPVGDLSEQ